MALTFPRRITSTPTTITVSGLPAWFTSLAAGRWHNVNLPAATPRARADSTLAGTIGQGGYFASNRFSNQNPWYDYTGGFWNPNISTHGAWCIRGGGHATSRSMLDTGLYVWNTGDRLWERYDDPVFPGDLPVEVPGYGWAGDDHRTNGTPWYNFDTMTDLLDPKWDLHRLYGEIVANPTGGYVPAADHNRFALVYVPPGFWGTGAKGGLILPVVNSFHITGNSNQAHLFNFDTRKWSRIGDWEASLGPKNGTNACLDGEGNLWHWRGISTYTIRKLPHNGSTWQAMSISNLVATYGADTGAMVWVPGSVVGNTKGAILNNSWVGASSLLNIINLDSPTTCVIPGGGRGWTGSIPNVNGSSGDCGAGIEWCSDLNALVIYSSADDVVTKVSPPANPFTQNWVCTPFASANTPAIIKSGIPSFYNKFRYAPALKAFFIVGNAYNDDMWCFKPSELWP